MACRIRPFFRGDLYLWRIDCEPCEGPVEKLRLRIKPALRFVWAVGRVACLERVWWITDQAFFGRPTEICYCYMKPHLQKRLRLIKSAEEIS